MIQLRTAVIIGIAMAIVVAVAVQDTSRRIEGFLGGGEFLTSQLSGGGASLPAPASRVGVYARRTRRKGLKSQMDPIISGGVGRGASVI